MAVSSFPIDLSANIQILEVDFMTQATCIVKSVSCIVIQVFSASETTTFML